MTVWWSAASRGLVWVQGEEEQSGAGQIAQEISCEFCPWFGVGFGVGTGVMVGAGSTQGTDEDGCGAQSWGRQEAKTRKGWMDGIGRFFNLTGFSQAHCKQRRTPRQIALRGEGEDWRGRSSGIRFGR